MRAPTAIVAAIGIAMAAGCDDPKAAPPPPPRNAGNPICDPPRDAEDLSRSCATVAESEPHLAIGPKGRIGAAWIALASEEISIGTTFSDDAGVSWSDIAAVPAPDGRIASDPVLAAADDDSFMLAYIGFRTTTSHDLSDMHVYVARAASGVDTFDAPIDISYPSDAAHLDKPWIVRTPKGAWLVVHAFDRSTLGGLAVARSTDGSTFTHAIVAQGSTTLSYRNLAFPCVSAETGRIYIAYFEIFGTAQGKLELHWSDDDGVTWPSTSFSLISDPAESMAFGQAMCAAHGQDVWASYGLSATENVVAEAPVAFPPLNAIRLAHSTDGGVTFATRADVQDPRAGSLFLHPALTPEADGSLDLAYYAAGEDPDTSAAFVRARKAAADATFSASEAFDTPILFTTRRDQLTWLGDYAGLTWRAGTLAATWIDSTADDAHVVFGSVKTP